MIHERTDFTCGRVVSPIHGVEVVAAGGAEISARTTFEVYNVATSTWRILKSLGFMNQLATGVQFGDTGTCLLLPQLYWGFLSSCDVAFTVSIALVLSSNLVQKDINTLGRVGV